MKTTLVFLMSLNLILSPVALAKEGQSKGYADQILGIGNGILGATIIMDCPMASMSTSMMAYMGASVVYIGSEILGGEGFTQKKKDQAKKLDEMKATMKEGGDYQKAAIDAQLEDEKNTLEMIQKRRKWIMVVKAGYAVATGLAAWELWQELRPDGEMIKVGCEAGHTSNRTLLTKSVATAYAGLQGFSGGGMMGGAVAAGAAGAGAFFAELEIVNKALSATVNMLNSAKGRLAAFGAATALAVMIDSNLAKEEEKSEKKIKELTKARSQFYLDTASSNQLAEGSSGASLDMASGKSYALKPLPTAANSKSCFSNANNQVTYSAEGCASPLNIKYSGFRAEMNLPTLMAGSSTLNDMSNAVASGDLEKANLSAAKLSSMAAKLDAVNKNLLTKVNDQLKKSGQKPVDINESLSNQMKSMGDAFNNQPSSAAPALAGAAQNSDSGKEKDTINQSVGSVATATANVGAPSAVVESSNDLLEEEGVSQGLTEQELIATQSKIQQSLNDLEIEDKNDISKASDVSIFKQVSNRYLLNYNKIFDKKQLTDEPKN
jgi:hypothetical protein